MKFDLYGCFVEDGERKVCETFGMKTEEFDKIFTFKESFIEQLLLSFLQSRHQRFTSGFGQPKTENSSRDS